MQMRQGLRLAGWLAILLTIAGCQTIPQQKLHYTMLDAPTLPSGDVIVLPMDIKVKEMSAAGQQEEVPAWSKQANNNFRHELGAQSPGQLAGLKLRFAPDLLAEDQAQVDEYLALTHVVAGNALVFTGPLGGEAWRHKAKHFDYSIGPGLSFLADQTGADKALLLIGEDVHSSSGRKAAFVMAAAFGVAIPLGHTVAIAALVDLRTGNVLWMNHYVSTGAVSFLEANDTETVISELFKDYPGLEDYRQFVQGS
jgi:hypothetical protein